MWKCPNCETLNDAEVCIVCGEKRPMPGDKPLSEGKKLTYTSSGPATYGREGGNNQKNWILYVIIAIIALFIIIGLMVSESEAAEMYKEADIKYQSAVCYSANNIFSGEESSIFDGKQICYQADAQNQYNSLLFS